MTCSLPLDPNYPNDPFELLVSETWWHGWLEPLAKGGCLHLRVSLGILNLLLSRHTYQLNPFSKAVLSLLLDSSWICIPDPWKSVTLWPDIPFWGESAWIKWLKRLNCKVEIVNKNTASLTLAALQLCSFKKGAHTNSYVVSKSANWFSLRMLIWQ